MSELAEIRMRKDRFFALDTHSPLSPEQKRGFTALKYYPEDPTLRFEVTVKHTADRQMVQMQTSTGETRDYCEYGTIEFEIEGKPVTLAVYTSGNGDAFVPFTDATTGSETYGAGRYLELEWLVGDRFIVDFNLAYNPWCAYSPTYSCPIPPKENRLDVPIRAGEKDFKVLMDPV